MRSWRKSGRGTYGKVYKARDRSTGRLVALKKTRLEVRVSFSRAFARRARRRRPRSGRRCRGFFLFQAASDGFHRGGYGREMRALSRPRVARIAALSRCASSACPRRLREASLPSNALEPRPTGSFPRRGDARKKSASDARAHPSSSPSPPLPRAIRWRKRASRPRRCARFPSCRCSARARSSSGTRAARSCDAQRASAPADRQRDVPDERVFQTPGIDLASSAAPTKTRARSALFSNRPRSLTSRAFPSTELTRPRPPRARVRRSRPPPARARRLLKVEHVEEDGKAMLYLVFEYLDQDLKNYMDHDRARPGEPAARSASCRTSCTSCASGARTCTATA